MSTIADTRVATPETAARLPWTRLRKPALAVGAAAAVLAVAALLHQFIPGGNGSGAASVFDLLAQAAVAEEALFAGDKIVHIKNEIVVKPVSDPVRAKSRWYPVASMEATGKPRFHQLTLSAEVGKGYTVEDHAWYDPATSSFIRLFSVGGTPIYANAFDGQAVYLLEVADDGTRRVTRHPITKGFQPPKRPADFLGIAAGLRYPTDEEIKQQFKDVSEVKEVTLDDGCKARVVKVATPPVLPGREDKSYLLYTIRTDNNTIAQTEFVHEAKPHLVVRRVKTETVEAPDVPWNLAGLESQVAKAKQKPQAGIKPDLLILDVTVEHMVQKASFETYLFFSDPPWAGKRQIADCLDPPSPTHRMFVVACRADDGRHVVLAQSHTYNTMLGQLTQIARLAYESPSGVKVWSGPKDQWLAGILLSSARAWIKDPPSDDRTGYLLQTPAGTFPVLAINGQVSEEELHALIDSLVPAKACLKQDKQKNP